MKNLIVTRHQGAIDWLKSKNITGEVISHIDPACMDRDVKCVYGVFPIHIAAELIQKRVKVFNIIMPTLPLEFRGQELTAELMHQFGAKLIEIKKLQIVEI